MNKRLMMSTSDTSLAPLMYVRALLPTSSVKVPKGSVVSKIKDRWFQAQALVSFKKCIPPPSPLQLNTFHLFVILSLIQLYRYTPEIFLFSTATFKYTYRAPLRRIGQEYSANVAYSTFKSLKRIQPLPVRSKLI